MGKIKLAVIGLGNMGRRMVHHLVPQYADRTELVAICDSREDVLRSESESLGRPDSLSLYTDYRRLLEETDADLVYIAVPPSMHYEAARLAFERGIHVFCEKPLANSLEEAEEMVKLAERADRLNIVHFSFPLEAPVLEFRRRIRQGDVGEISRINLYLEFPRWPRAWQQNDWISTRREGGYLLEVGIHWIQMIQQTFGRIAAVSSEIVFPADGGLCESTVQAVMVLESGQEIQISGTDRRESEDERVSLVVQGSGGTLALENWGHLFAGGPGEEPQPVAVAEQDEENGLGGLPIFGQVLNLLEGRSGTAYDFRDGYEAQIVLEALRDPAAEGGLVQLNRK
ncbi:oxidoreductase [Saccharibacillus sp. O23]|uniref:Gfo/Idh/MocA family protein n=1 Tax=Saccharibacillus sp. O23 TaxID=2009338 RepID=UPI000B4E4A7B|nr:Gfo/Idh/MocA family oxidoreductase [Saccharibacillus sp. O23]OWR31985.1 oxidoreductase [Saccharibacillus sp. O23]